MAVPQYKGLDPKAVWPEFFEKNRVAVDDVRRLILRLHNAKEYEHVIVAIQSAILTGQAQPWMYEVLAMEMEIQKRPKEEIERVALSLTDFGAADFGSMMYSGAYLAGFNRPVAAVKMYRQASRMAPEQPEPYVMGFDLAKNSADPQDILWAVTGMLEKVWDRNYAARHQAAEDLAADTLKAIRKTHPPEVVTEFETALQAARSRDVRVVIRWAGDADLDLLVEEPGGGTCSIEQRLSTGGGVFLRDGFGPQIAECYEEYICPRAISGEYRVRIRTHSGTATGNKVELNLTTHVHTPQEKNIVKFLTLEEGVAVYVFRLDDGRRTEVRYVAPQPKMAFSPRPAQRPVRRVVKQGPDVIQAAAEFISSPQFPGRPFVGGVNAVNAGGVVGYQPVIQIVPEGTQLYARAAISPDRRYVRIAINPVFSTINNVFTFSFLGGGGAVQQPGGGPGR